MRKIIVIRNGAIGDFTLTLPAIDSIHKAFPDNNLQLIGQPNNIQLCQVNLQVSYDDPRLTPLHRTGPIPQETRDLFVDTERILVYAVDSKRQLERQLTQLSIGPVLFCDPRPPADASVHIVDHLLSPLQTWNIPPARRSPHIELNSKDYRYAETLPSMPDVVIHPGSSSPDKCWPEQHFCALAAQLAKRGWATAIICGPIEIERGLVGDSLQPPNLRSLAGLLSCASLFIGNDSGPGHIAAAVGTPTLSLFGPTDPRIWAPRNTRAKVLLAPTKNIDEIPLEIVFEAALQLLESRHDER